MLLIATLALFLPDSAAVSAQARRREQVREVLVRAGEIDRADAPFRTGDAVHTVFMDLDGDGRSEALAYVAGPNTCGTSGCSLFVLERRSSTYRIIGSLFGHTPVRVLTIRHRGWRDISLRAAGGGVLHPYDAAFAFDGVRYAGFNASNPPARRVRPGVPATVVIR